MGAELVRRAGALVRRSGTDLTRGGVAQSTASVPFEGTVVLWRDLPLRTRRAARRRSPIVAEAVQCDPRHRIEGARRLEYASGWRMHEDGVVLAEVARSIAPDGARALGAWEHRAVRVWEAAGPPQRRRGLVGVADEIDSRGRGAGELLGIVAHGHGPAAEAWRHLPQTVRTAAERLVPEPVVWLGEITQITGDDRLPLQQDIRSVRISAERAVAIVATRALSPIRGAKVEYHVEQMARAPWLVEQVGFDLRAGSDRSLLEARRQVESDVGLAGTP